MHECERGKGRGGTDGEYIAVKLFFHCRYKRHNKKLYSVHEQFHSQRRDVTVSERERATETGAAINKAKEGTRWSAEEVEMDQMETEDVGQPQETGAGETDDYYFQDPSSIGKQSPQY